MAHAQNTTAEDVQLPAKSSWHKVPLIGGILGVVLLAIWATSFKSNPDRAMYGYMFAFASVLSLSLGCLFFVIIQHLTRAGWSVLVRRTAEFGAASLPMFAVLFLPIALLAHDLFPWSHVEAHDAVLNQKAPYLNMPFFMVRSAIYLVLWTVLGWWFFRTSVRQDGGQRSGDTRKLWAFSAPAIIVFALSTTFASFDWIMSLQPHWYSTIFGVYFFAGCFLSGMAFLTLVLMAFQASGALHKSVTTEHYHDLGKLMFGFTVFWAYIGFSQFMLYWYANIPEEIEFFLVRLEHGWGTLSYALPITNFFIPFFFLLSRHTKRNKLTLALFCIWTLCFHFVDLYWLILPNYGAHGVEGVLPGFAPSVFDAAALVGMLCLMIALIGRMATRHKLAPVGDPKLHESLAFENF